MSQLNVTTPEVDILSIGCVLKQAAIWVMAGLWLTKATLDTHSGGKKVVFLMLG
jgi:hypothetical protein